jgi:hypothetical protein
MGWGERRGLDLGSHCFSGSAGGAWGREKSPALRGKCRGIGGVLKWLGVPSVVGYDPHQDQDGACKVHLVMGSGLGHAQPLTRDVD